MSGGDADYSPGFAGAHPLAFDRLAFISIGDAVPVHCGMSEQRGVGMGGYSPGLGTWVGFDSLVFVRQRRVTWQSRPVRCGNQRVRGGEGRWVLTWDSFGSLAFVRWRLFIRR